MLTSIVSAGLILIWGIGVATSHTMGGLIHVALFVAGLAFFLRILTAASLSYTR